ncbi:4-galactosyl-N-acetylglucosaminide 3-alpha-L-fucosyltransferase FUT5 (3-galactosyl-N-acetylglucosaminide 4-alpha-L-fucosyltransferase FUT5) (Fucosyltransferase 5) (Fucosyltransferase V) (Fuc-TV) (FucT-V) (Galactoside 3-L-fucosyltransferase) [Durusdinium trenchii]|uniref:Fucosyltransferase n=1 Tax=Durusdinium trenchii TaxID=1381693 RepID=A0ABP0IQ35_9DINO
MGASADHPWYSRRCCRIALCLATVVLLQATVAPDRAIPRSQERLNVGGSARGARSSPASGVEEVISSNVSEGGDLPENEQEDKEDLAMDQEVVEEKQDEEEVILPNLSRTTAVIFVNCAEDGKSLRRGRYIDKHLTCPQSQCVLTNQLKEFSNATAAVFNPLWMSPMHSAPLRKPDGQLWVYSFFFESPASHRFAQRATEQLGARIDLTMTFQTTSEIVRPYYGLQPCPGGCATNAKNYATGKKYLLLWLVSNCGGGGGRRMVFKKIQEQLGADAVHKYGRCGKAIPCKRRDAVCERKFFDQYKFYAAFETSRCQGYITEKFYRGFQTTMVPLAYGGLSRQDYEGVVPKESFLHVDDFVDAAQLATTLRQIDRDDQRYNRFHTWREKFRVMSQIETHHRAYCELCDRLANRSAAKRPFRTSRDLTNWMFNRCAKDMPRWK